MNVRVAVAVALSICILLTTSDPAPAAVAKNCHVGSYRLRDGKVVDIAPSDGEALRWTLWSGETGKLHPQPGGTWKSTFGWTDRPDGKKISFSDCNAGEIAFDGLAG